MDWKSPPADPAKNWINKSIELQINLFCNWTCIACDSFSQFPFPFTKRGTMSVAQVSHFADELIEVNGYFGRLRLLGGEPSLNPNFVEIAKLLHERLVVPGYLGRLEVVTNGSHQEKILPAKPYIAKVRVSDEGDKQKHHTANLIHSPASLGYEGKICSSPWHCGISLNYWGYFPCSSGAGLSRFRDMTQWQRLSLPLSVNWKYPQKPTAVRDNWPDLQQLCNHCYHGLRDEHKIKSGTSDPERNKPNAENQAMLDAWLAGKQPDWPIYGATA